MLYGDGVFRTLKVLDGCIQYWLRHYRKLQQDCNALGIACPEAKLLYEELQSLIVQQPQGIARIAVTRGEQQAHGYRATANLIPTRILSITPPFYYSEKNYSHGVRVHICDLRLAHQPKLAGVKHLNRLENVLAAAEYDDPDIAEGLLLDVSGNVIEGIRSNLFMVRDGELFTPSLSSCGVAGVQRDRVIEWAAGHGVPCWVRQFGLAELLAADEIFLVNSLIGLWPVRELSGIRWDSHPISMRVQDWISHEYD